MKALTLVFEVLLRLMRVLVKGETSTHLDYEKTMRTFL